MDYSLDEIEYGTIDCLTESANGYYCQTWHHVQKQYQRCWNEWITVTNNDGSVSTTLTEICCNKDNKYSYPCCQQICSTTYYNSQLPVYEYLDCECVEESPSGRYCQRWTCEQYMYESQSKWDAREYEKYECWEADSNENFCMHWQGHSHSVKEFEVSKYNCDTVSDNGLYCQGWSCHEKGVPIWYPNMLWALLPALLGIWVPIAYCGIMGKGDIDKLVIYSDDNVDETSNREEWIYFLLVYALPSLIWSGGFLFIAIWKAGVGVLVTIGIILLVPLPLYLLCMYLFHPRSRMWPKQRTRQVYMHGEWVTRKETDPCCPWLFGKEIEAPATEDPVRRVSREYELAGIDEGSTKETRNTPASDTMTRQPSQPSSTSYSYSTASDIPSNSFDALPGGLLDEDDKKKEKNKSTKNEKKDSNYRTVRRDDSDDEENGGIRVTAVPNSVQSVPSAPPYNPGHRTGDVATNDEQEMEIPMAFAYAMPVAGTVTVVSNIEEGKL